MRKKRRATTSSNAGYKSAGASAATSCKTLGSAGAPSTAAASTIRRAGALNWASRRLNASCTLAGIGSARPSSVGSYDSPFQLPPPTVLGKVTIVPSGPGGVYGPLVYIRLLFHSSLQYAACSGVSV